MISPNPRSLRTRPVSYSMWLIALSVRASSSRPRLSLPHRALRSTRLWGCKDLRIAQGGSDRKLCCKPRIGDVLSRMGQYSGVGRSLAKVMEVLATSKKESAPANEPDEGTNMGQISIDEICYASSTSMSVLLLLSSVTQLQRYQEGPETV
jgi:hypothetical protein